MSKWLAAAFVVLAVTSGAAAEEDCRLERAAMLPFTLTQDGRIVVPAAVGDTPLSLMIDTGTPASILTFGAAGRLGLTPAPMRASISMQMYGGLPIVDYVRIKGFRLGAMTASVASFGVMLNVLEGDGLLGDDFLMQFDVDLDFAGGKVNLFRPHRCEGRVVYWASDDTPVAIIPFKTKSDDTHIKLEIAVDDHPAPAVLDTGASKTVMNLETATHWYNITVNSPGVEKIGDDLYRYRFKTLTLEGVTVANPEIYMQPAKVSKFPNDTVLLGIDILRKLHLYIAYEEHKLYVTAADAH